MLTAEQCRSLLAYDEATGIFTRRASKRGDCVGRRAGVVTTNGYLRIRIGTKWYPAHRLAWLYVYGEWPPDDIDHADVNRQNNRIGNLRLATRTQNHANRMPQPHSSRFKGVSFDKQTGRWRASIKMNRRLIALGRHDTEEQAHAAYVSAAARHFGEFARAE